MDVVLDTVGQMADITFVLPYVSRVRDREVQPRSPMLGPRGERRARWVGRCEEVSAPRMCAGNGGAQIGDPVLWPLAAGVRWDSVLFPKAFWRIGYRRLKFTFSVFRLY